MSDKHAIYQMSSQCSVSLITPLPGEQRLSYNLGIFQKCLLWRICFPSRVSKAAECFASKCLLMICLASCLRGSKTYHLFNLTKYLFLHLWSMHIYPYFLAVDVGGVSSINSAWTGRPSPESHTLWHWRGLQTHYCQYSCYIHTSSSSR